VKLRVGVGDQHLGISIELVNAADRGVGLRRDQHAIAFVLAVAGTNIVSVDHTGDALHIHRHKDPHPDHTPPTPVPADLDARQIMPSEERRPSRRAPLATTGNHSRGAVIAMTVIAMTVIAMTVIAMTVIAMTVIGFALSSARHLNRRFGDCDAFRDAGGNDAPPVPAAARQQPFEGRRACPGSRTSGPVPQRTVRKNARTSPANSSGTSSAAK
jgi:hypothetical protein